MRLRHLRLRTLIRRRHRARATGLEPATSGVTGRSCRFRSRRGCAGIPAVSRVFRHWRCGDCPVGAGASGDLLRDGRGMRRCLSCQRAGAVLYAAPTGWLSVNDGKHQSTPLYHGTAHATGGNPRQRFALVSAVCEAIPVCDRLPLIATTGSIKGSTFAQLAGAQPWRFLRGGAMERAWRAS